jgi:hypothetical protein
MSKDNPHDVKPGDVVEITLPRYMAEPFVTTIHSMKHYPRNDLITYRDLVKPDTEDGFSRCSAQYVSRVISRNNYYDKPKQSTYRKDNLSFLRTSNGRLLGGVYQCFMDIAIRKFDIPYGIKEDAIFDLWEHDNRPGYRGEHYLSERARRHFASFGPYLNERAFTRWVMRAYPRLTKGIKQARREDKAREERQDREYFDDLAKNGDY